MREKDRQRRKQLIYGSPAYRVSEWSLGEAGIWECREPTAGLDEPGAEIDAVALAVVQAATEVHRHLGPGYLESVYEEAVAVELQLRSIPFERQKAIHIDYKGTRIGEARLDLLVGGKLVVELMAVESIMPIHRAQIISYLKATGLRVGLLFNFNVVLLRDGIQRVILSV